MSFYGDQLFRAIAATMLVFSHISRLLLFKARTNIVAISTIGAAAMRSLRRNGISATARKALSLFRSVETSRPDRFDIVRGTDTGGQVSRWKLGGNLASARFAVRFQPSNPDEIRHAVRFSQVVPSATTFIDLGCGKGRGLIVAAELGFQKIVGVEFSPGLVEICRANVAHLALNNTEVLNLDAAQYPFPDDDFVLYMYNPFSKEVMRRVVGNLRASRAKGISVIYQRAVCAELFDKCDLLARLGSPPENSDLIVWQRRQSSANSPVTSARQTARAWFPSA
jgi:Methyltransferase domain